MSDEPTVVGRVDPTDSWNAEMQRRWVENENDIDEYETELENPEYDGFDRQPMLEGLGKCLLKRRYMRNQRELYRLLKIMFRDIERSLVGITKLDKTLEQLFMVETKESDAAILRETANRFKTVKHELHVCRNDIKELAKAQEKS